MSVPSLDTLTHRRADPHLAWGIASAAAASAVGVAAGRSPLLGVGVLAFIVVSYAVVRCPFIGVVVLVALTPIVSAMRRGLIVPGLRPSEALVAWLVPLIVLFARRPVPQWTMLEWLGLAYAGGTLIIGAYDLWRRHAPLNSESVRVLLGPAQYLLLLRAVRVGVRSAQHRYRAAALLILAALPVSVFALLQGFGLAWAQHLSVHLTGVYLGHPERATGPFTSWQVLAGYLVAVGLLTTAVLVVGARRILVPRAAAAALVLIVAALARTLTVGAFAGWLAGAVALAAWSGRLRLSAAKIAGLAGLAVVLLSLILAARYQQEFHTVPGQRSTGLVPSTIADRFDHWTQQYVPALSQRWVTGFGPGTPPGVTTKYTDSVYLTLVLRGGLMLLALYGALMLGFIAVARRVQAYHAESEALARGLIVLVAVLVPLQVIATYFTTSGLPEVIWIMAALVSTIPFVPKSPPSDFERTLRPGQQAA